VVGEEEEEFITSGNGRGKHNSLSRGASADQEEEESHLIILKGKSEIIEAKL
jgi:hypothetical protein